MRRLSLLAQEQPTVAVTMLRRPEPPEWKVEPTTLGVTAIEFPSLD